MVANCTWCYPMVDDGNHWQPMVLNGSQWYWMLPNCNQWFQMVSNGNQWYQMVPDGTQWSSVTQMNLYMLAEWSNGGSGRFNLRLDTSDRNFFNVDQDKKRSTPRNFFTSSLLWEVVTHKSESKYFWGMIKCRLGKLKLQTGYLEQKMFISDISKATLTLILILLDHSVSVFMGKKRKSYQGSTLVAFSFLQRETAPQ